jgi:hypothetical protein
MCDLLQKNYLLKDLKSLQHQVFNQKFLINWAVAIFEYAVKNQAQ